MAIDDVVITPENCDSLKNLLDFQNPDEKEDYELIESCVRCHLFSIYKKRSEFALVQLKKFFSEHTNVYTIKKEGFIWAYICSRQEKDSFLLVEKYPDDPRPKLEPAPLDIEEKLWAEYFDRK